jgi:hypothetical protein
MMSSDRKKTVQDIVEKISDLLARERLRREIDEPIDLARDSFSVDTKEDTSGKSFHKALAAFAQHLFTRGLKIEQRLTNKEALATAIEILQQGYQSEHGSGYDAAYFDAVMPHQNGIEYVVWQMAELVKTAERTKYVRSALSTCIDPTDWEAKCRLTEFLLKRLEPTLPPEILQVSVERMAADWQDLLLTYVDPSGMLHRYLPASHAFWAPC